MHWLGGDTDGVVNMGTLAGNTGDRGVRTNLDNVWMYQINGNYRITPKLDISASYTYAYADKPDHRMLPVSRTNPEFISKKYGSELMSS